jgi:hypothetical protein
MAGAQPCLWSGKWSSVKLKHRTVEPDPTVPLTSPVCHLGTLLELLEPQFLI